MADESLQSGQRVAAVPVAEADVNVGTGVALVAPQVPCNIPGCCVKTITEHVRFNAMMVCSDCKNIIKCFEDERAFQNYLTFCRSRRRAVLTGRIADYWTVAFRSYDTFGR